MSARSPLVLTLLLLALFAPAAHAVPPPGGAPEGMPAGPVLATDRPASRTPVKRWIIQLKDPALAQAPDDLPGFGASALRAPGTGRLLADSPAAMEYRRRLEQKQASLFTTLQGTFPGAQLQRRYQVVFNGMSVLLPGGEHSAIERLRAMPEVAQVYPDLDYELTMFSSIPLIGADALWSSPSIGGVQNAGAGVKIAVVDSGIRVDNPFFNPAGFSYPPGFPKGVVEHTTAKVIAARTYIRADRPPAEGSETPQPGPMDSGHGTHVAGTAAGVANTTASVSGLSQTLSGVAPRAYLMNYKVFYANEAGALTASNVEIIAAIEDAVADGADIINMSLGSLATVDPSFDPLVVAAEAATDAGVTVVVAGGNEGPDPATSSSPGLTEKLITVGATTTGQTIVSNFVVVTAPEGVPDELKRLRYQPAAFGPRLRDTALGPAPYTPVAAIAGSSLACEPLPAGSLAGQIALIERGICPFELKVLVAQEAGAIAAIVYNSPSGGEELVTMGGDEAGRITIPSGFVARSSGLLLLEWFDEHGPDARLQLDPRGQVQEQTPDVLAAFSSRGPTFTGALKPDVVAPGVNIVSAGFADAEGIAQHQGFGIISGTSMAAPHVAGGAALLQQVHPTWSSQDIRSALMSTAVTDVYLDQDRAERASILQQGAGRIALDRAASVALLFDRPSLSFGRIQLLLGQPTRASAVVSARNVSGEAQSYNLTGRSMTEGINISVSPATITLAPGASASFTVDIEMPAGAAATSYEGMVEVNGPQQLHLPLAVVALPAQPGPKVLLLDNDGSASFEFPDYAAYYGNLLESLGISYTHYDVDSRAGNQQTLPDSGELQRYEIILWFTGDNFVPSGAVSVPTPLTATDQNLLISYLQAGGGLLATGQDLTWAADVNASTNPNVGRSDLYHYYMGAVFVQDDVFTRTATLERMAVGSSVQPWLDNLVVDVRNPDAEEQEAGAVTSAGNQSTVDEIYPIDASITPLLKAVSTGTEASGIVGVSNASEPTLEEPTPAYRYRSTYLSFGLEGVRNDTGATTRTELTQSLLYWHVDRPQVTVEGSPAVTDASQLARFTARATTNTPATFYFYRWDFGDGTPIFETFEPTVVHQYQEAGTYNVRVEAVDTYGHHAVSGGGGATIEPDPTPVNPQAVRSSEVVAFDETGESLGGRFLDYWRGNGGLPVFGYPLSTPGMSGPISQVFERARFEYAPKNRAPYDVLLGHLGVEALEARGQNWRSFPTVTTAPAGCLYFVETSHSLCGPFKAYWERNGLEFDGKAGSSFAESLALFGLPLSEPHEELAEDGTTRIVQWFERARFEYHPQNAAPYDVLLARLGASLSGNVVR